MANTKNHQTCAAPRSEHGRYEIAALTSPLGIIVFALIAAIMLVRTRTASWRNRGYIGQPWARIFYGFRTRAAAGLQWRLVDARRARRNRGLLLSAHKHLKCTTPSAAQADEFHAAIGKPASLRPSSGIAFQSPEKLSNIFRPGRMAP
jgi:hypothetical protein